MSHTHITSLRRATIGAALMLAGLAAATTPALAAPTTDGTSNTIMVAVTSVRLDQAHNRVVVTAPAPGRLSPERRLDSVQVVTPQLTYVLTNTMVSGLTGPSSTLSLNFTKVEIVNAPEPCRSGMDACLMEEDGTYPLATANGSASWDLQQATAV
jgi:hypothetical protein